MFMQPAKPEVCGKLLTNMSVMMGNQLLVVIFCENKNKKVIRSAAAVLLILSLKLQQLSKFVGL